MIDDRPYPAPFAELRPGDIFMADIYRHEPADLFMVTDSILAQRENGKTECIRAVSLSDGMLISPKDCDIVSYYPNFRICEQEIEDGWEYSAERYEATKRSMALNKALDAIYLLSELETEDGGWN